MLRMWTRLLVDNSIRRGLQFQMGWEEDAYGRWWACQQILKSLPVDKWTGLYSGVVLCLWLSIWEWDLEIGTEIHGPLWPGVKWLTSRTNLCKSNLYLLGITIIIVIIIYKLYYYGCCFVSARGEGEVCGRYVQRTRISSMSLYSSALKHIKSLLICLPHKLNYIVISLFSSVPLSVVILCVSV